MIGLWLETNGFMGTCSFMEKKNYELMILQSEVKTRQF